MATKFYPLFDRVLVKPVAETITSKGGLVIPEISRERPQEGEVVAVGPGKYENGFFIATKLRPGDRILFGKFAGTTIKLDDELFLIISEPEVLGNIDRIPDPEEIPPETLESNQSTWA